MIKSIPIQATTEQRRAEAEARFLARSRARLRIAKIDRAFVISLLIAAPIIALALRFTDGFALWLIAMQPMLFLVVMIGIFLRH